MESVKNQLNQDQKEMILWIAKKQKSFKQYFQKLQVLKSQQDGYGIYTKTKIQKQEVVLEISKKLFLNIDNMYDKQTKEVQSLVDQIDQHHKMLMFCILLYLEISRKESEWLSYLKSITIEGKEGIIDFDGEKTQHLTKQNYIKEVEDLNNESRQELEIFYKILDKQNLQENLMEQLRSFDMKAYKKMMKIVYSRSLHMPSQMDWQSEVGAMVPFYDLCNHRYLDIDIHQYFYYDVQSQTYVLKAYKDFEPGEQIYINYGNKNDFHFLLYYNFNPRNTENNYFQIQVPSNLLLETLGLKNLSKNHLELIQQIFPHLVKVQHPKYVFNDNYSFEIQINQNRAVLRWQDHVLVQILFLQKLKKESLKIVQNVLDEESQETQELFLQKFRELKRLFYSQFIHYLKNQQQIEKSQPEIHYLLSSQIKFIQNLNIN